MDYEFAVSRRPSGAHLHCLECRCHIWGGVGSVRISTSHKTVSVIGYYITAYSYSEVVDGVYEQSATIQRL